MSVRSSELPLSALPIFSWRRESDGMLRGKCGRYEALVLALLNPERWCTMLSAGGVVVHVSEHVSADGAQMEAWHALQRAIAIRERG